MKKNIVLRYLFLFSIVALLFTGCTIIIEPPTYYPEKTIDRLGKAVRQEKYINILNCFTDSLTVWSENKWGERYQLIWEDSDAANFFFFEPNPVTPGTTVFSFTLGNIFVDAPHNAATISGDLNMKGLKTDDYVAMTYVYSGKIVFYLKRQYSDHWEINGMDLSKFNLVEKIPTKSIE